MFDEGTAARDPKRDATLMAAACRLADLGARLHPDHRAELAFDQVLRAPVPGQSHPERAFLAAAVFSRHTAGPLTQVGAGIARILSPERQRRARALGAAIRLGCDLSGRAPTLLAATTLALDGGLVTLTVKRTAADLLLGEQTRKRLQSLAGVLELEGKIRTA
jgi:exopolyphosphatase/guanosine-5'-triphosphate,3'-diphosphate pyrophosphatase